MWQKLFFLDNFVQILRGAGGVNISTFFKNLSPVGYSKHRFKIIWPYYDYKVPTNLTHFYFFFLFFINPAGN